MRVVIFQPPYPCAATPAEARVCLAWMTAHFETLRVGEQDLVLLPEYANAPGLEDRDAVREFARTDGRAFIEHMREQARRLGCRVGLGTVTEVDGRWLNRAVLCGPDGEQAAVYDKVHLTDVERDGLGVTAGAAPVVAECGGVRIGFAICFDLYFPEFFEALAAQRPHLILCPSYQRSETPGRLRFVGQCRALDTGAYLIRSSYAMGTEERGGHSLIVAPDGNILADAGAEPDVLTVEIDPENRFVKPASYGQAPVEHRDLIEAHRQPTAYRERML